ncbi:MAG: tRNA-dependent cyclodipeptide synthase [Alphaproteobacteria bacterium]|nr:tRNA-dependent cyclodipeptide synthase [Alphaproteobacteria bacterium]
MNMNPCQEYKVCVRSGASWRDYSRIRLRISVGKPYHEGAKLQAVVDWINKNPNITEVQVCVSDFLQRHNLIAYGEDEERASYMALLAGTSWMERNESILSGLQPKWSFTRWADWFGTDEFHEIHVAILRLEADDPAFKEKLNLDASSLARRKKLRDELIPKDLVQHSYKFVTEELAVFAMQSRHFPAAEVCPGTSLDAVKYLYGKNLPEILIPLKTRYIVRINFERRYLASAPSDRAFTAHIS